MPNMELSVGTNKAPSMRNTPYPILYQIWEYLSRPKDKFRLATVFRIAHLQAIALDSISSASMDAASSRGDVSLLDFHLKHKDVKRPHSLHRSLAPSGNLAWTEISTRDASKHGHIHVLDWWLASDLPIKVSDLVITRASQCRQLPVLKWWKDKEDRGLVSGVVWDMILVLHAATYNGDLEMLEWLVECSGKPIPPAIAALDWACWEGHAEVLEWWRSKAVARGWGVVSLSTWQQFETNTTNYDTTTATTTITTTTANSSESLVNIPTVHIVTSPNAIDRASRYGHAHVLEWWKTSGLTCEYSEDSMSSASRNGHIPVLQWWKDSGLELKFDHAVMDSASSFGHVDVLQWWKDSGLELEWTSDAIDMASAKGHVHVLKWWQQSGLELKWTETAVKLASRAGHLDSLEWWLNSGLDMSYDGVIDEASACGRIDVLEWWMQSGLKVEWTEQAMDGASAYGQIHVLDWWKNSGLEIKWSPQAMNSASVMGQLQSLEWWRKSGLECRYSANAYEHNQGVLSWWINSGLEMSYLRQPFQITEVEDGDDDVDMHP